MPSIVINRFRKRLRTMAAIRSWVQAPFTWKDRQEEVRSLMRTRDQRFLELMRKAVYGFSKSPYLKLLRNIGCEYEDLKTQVSTNGLDATLQHLSGKGVYVTHDEMKGREPARRGSAVFYFDASDFDNPLIRPQFGYETSGSTGKATSVGVTFQHFQQQLLHTDLSASFHGVKKAAIALWLPLSEWSISRSMRLVKLGMPPVRWFSQVPVFPSRKIGCALDTVGLIAFSRLYGMALPMPCYVPLSEPADVVSWMLSELGQDRRPFLITYPSTALRACAWAVQEGKSLEGALLLVAGESVTSAKRSTIESTGAACLPLFGATETGESAEGCLTPNDPDDMHLYTHKFGIISRRQMIGDDKGIDVLFFTTLGSATPKIFLNADIGDAGIVEERNCDCPWGRIGFKTHLRNVWSYAKLTAEGMTVPGDAVFSVLEEAMPKQFGGHAGDYQLLSEPGDKGITHYLLSVNSLIGTMDKVKVRNAFFEALVTTGATNRLVTEFLSRADQLKVVRRRPSVQTGGKSLPVVLYRRPVL